MARVSSLVVQAVAMLSILTINVASVEIVTSVEDSFEKLQTSSVTGRTGHFNKMCRFKEKPVKNEEIPAQKYSKKDKSSKQVEASRGYPDSNWACQVEIEQNFQLPESINFIENKESLLPAFSVPCGHWLFLWYILFLVLFHIL